MHSLDSREDQKQEVQLILQQNVCYLLVDLPLYIFNQALQVGVVHEYSCLEHCQLDQFEASKYLRDEFVALLLDFKKHFHEVALFFALNQWQILLCKLMSKAIQYALQWVVLLRDMAFEQ